MRNSLGELRWEEATYLEAELLARVFRTNSINAIVPKNCAPKTFQVVSKRWAMGHAKLRWQGATLKMHSCWHVFSGHFHQHVCSEKLHAQDLPKFPNPGPWDMYSFVVREGD